MDQLRFIAGQKRYNSCDVFRLWPLSIVGLGHGFPVDFGVDDAGQNGIYPHSGSLQLCGQRIHKRHRRSL
jgi:hypothetical protein